MNARRSCLRWLGLLSIMLLIGAFHGGVLWSHGNQVISPARLQTALAASGTEFYLPFPGGTEMYVYQGQEMKSGWSHYDGGPFEYAWDFTVDEQGIGGKGEASIVAVADGLVRRKKLDDFENADDPLAWGCYVVIEHDQFEPSIYSLYAHLHWKDGKCVWPEHLKLHEKIYQGQEVGKMGDSGSYGGKIHLHFQFQPLLSGRSADGKFADNDPDFVDSKPAHKTWVTSANPGSGVSPSANVDVPLIIDSSGSMAWNDPYNKRLEAARAYLTASRVGDRVAVVDFDWTGRLVHGLADVRVGSLPNPDLIAAIQTIDSYGSTNIREGIEVACQELVAEGQHAGRGAILLTDGGHNVGDFGSPQACFSQDGRRWPIFTFGFGAADMTLLETIAADTGGVATPIGDVTNLVCEFQQVRSLIAGEQPEPCTIHHVNPWETTSFYAMVPPDQAQATFSTSWAGSDVVMSLVTPSGRVIDRATVAPDVTHDSGPTFEVYSVTNPEPGEWEIKLYGADVPPEGEDVVFGFSSLPAEIVTVEIDIDVKPGGDPNSINLGSAGTTPVAVLTTDSVDANGIDPATVQFADSPPLRWSTEDVDGDGDPDAVFHFKTLELNLDEYSTLAALSGLTYDGLPVYGIDDVNIVP